MDVSEKKRKRQEKNKRRAQKKRAKKTAAYGRVPGAVRTWETNKSDSSEEDVENDSAEETTVEQVKVKKTAKKQKEVKPVKAGNTKSSKIEHIFQSEVDLASAGERVLKWMIAPTDLDRFKSEYFEKKPLLVRRQDQPQYFDGLLSSADIQGMLKAKKLHYTRDFSVTQYQDGIRKTLFTDTTAVANAEKVWKLYEGPEKCSLRLLRPHNHSELIWKIIAAFEGFWGCGGGANAYLTPKSSQGFAPHYDDIDAFILQLEGKKQWTVYDFYEPSEKKTTKTNTGNDEEEGSDEEIDEEENSDEDDETKDTEDEDPEDLFPRNPLESSKDFTEEQVKKHLKVALSVTLEPGDFLYIPRGMVHQARAKASDHSLHVTISSNQHNSWADFIALALPHAVERCCKTDLARDCAELRKSLPHNYLQYMGIMHSDNEADTRRAEFAELVTKLIHEHVLPNLEFDVVADRMGVRFQHDRHKPLGVLSALPASRELNDAADSDEDDEESKLSKETKFVLSAKGVATLTVEDDAAIVYHSCKNTTTYHETDTRGLEFDAEDAETIEAILKSDPVEVQMVRTLPHPGGVPDKIRVVSFLAKEKIVHIIP